MKRKKSESESNPPMASCRAAAARPESESKTRQNAADTRWLQTLSEPELDLLIGLKELAVTRASNAGHPHLAGRVFHLRMLRALGSSPHLTCRMRRIIHSRPRYINSGYAAFVLLEECKERLRQASSVNNTSMLERLALLNDPDPDPDTEVVRPCQDEMPVPTAVREKQKRMQDGCDEEGVQSPKRRKPTREAGRRSPQSLTKKNVSN